MPARASILPFRYRVHAINLSGYLDRWAQKDSETDCVFGTAVTTTTLNCVTAKRLRWIQTRFYSDLFTNKYLSANAIYKQTNQKQRAITPTESTMTAEFVLRKNSIVSTSLSMR